jgi:predicted flap endonuclease-1-like 5' DNA nuclease
VETIVLASLGALAVLLLISLLVVRRDRTRARRRAQFLERDISEIRSARDAATAGEREAVWALETTSDRLADSEADRLTVLERVETLEADLDELRTRLAEADADLASSRRDADEALTEVARLESELAANAREVENTNVELDEQIAALAADLESERGTVVRLRSDLDTSIDGDGESYRERLVASEARRRDLEDRLASLNAVRAAEQRTSADRIAGLERLHLQIGEREDRIDALESDLKTAEEARDDALEESSRLQVEIVRLKGELAEAKRRLQVLEQHGEALAEARTRISDLERQLEGGPAQEAEIGRLRKALDAERMRAERISRRATETGHDTTYAMWDRVVRERVEAAVARDTDRLTAQIEHLRAVVSEKEDRLRALAADGAGGGARRDDLPPVTVIKGIGVKIAGILAAHGIATVPDIAALGDEDIDALAGEMPIYPGRIRDDDWVGQARSILQAEPEVEDRTPSAPLPITAIKGIGPGIAAILADRSITTIADVASLTDDDIDALADAMPVYPGRIRDDDWVGQARSYL